MQLHASLGGSGGVCRYWAASGSCYYGDQCNYLHATGGSLPSLPSHNLAPPSREGRSLPPPAGELLSGHLPKSQRPCRNIEIYGYCKYAGKGCEYNHDSQHQHQPGTTGSFTTEGEAGIASLEGEDAVLLSIKRADPVHPPFTTKDSLYHPHHSPQQQQHPSDPSGARNELQALGYELGSQGGVGGRGQPSSSFSGFGAGLSPSTTTTSSLGGVAASGPPGGVRQPRSLQHLAAAPAFLTGRGGNGGGGSAPVASVAGGQSALPSYASAATKAPSVASSAALPKPKLSEEPAHQDYAAGRPPPNSQPTPLTAGPGHSSASAAAAAGGPPAGPITHGGTTYYSYDNMILPVVGAAPYGRQTGHLAPSGHLARQGGPTGRRSIQSFFVSEALRQDLAKRTLALYSADADPDRPTPPAPAQVGVYHSLQLLEAPLRERAGRVFGYATTVFRATSSVDGATYALRRIDGFRLTNKVAASHVLEQWRHFQHPNIVNLLDLILSSDADDTNSVYLVYEFVAGAESLEARYLQASNGVPLPEHALWSIFVQLSAVLRAIHAAGFAARSLDASKVLAATCAGRVRVKLGAVGLLDLVSPESVHDVSHFQREDLLALGKLILSLACRSALALENVSDALEYVASQYSLDLKQTLVGLLSHPGSASYPTAEQLCGMLAPRILLELEQAEEYSDALETELAKELENGRLFRLLVKLDLIDLASGDPTSWQEGGEQHALRLFREHVFQQLGEGGATVVDFGHVVECLNKLDLGTEERVALVARDNATVLVAAYKELKLASDAIFKQLCAKPPASATAAAPSYGGARHGRPYSSFASAAATLHLGGS